MSLRSGICPHCGTTDVFSDHANPINDETNSVQLGFSTTGFFSTSRTHARTYICTRCGLIERYIIDPTVLAQIREQWQAISVPVAI